MVIIVKVIMKIILNDNNFIIVTDNILENSFYALWCLPFSYIIVAMAVTLVTDSLFSFQALRVADGLDAGTCFVNTYNKTDVAAPFGGFKQSGFGKDLGRLVSVM